MDESESFSIREARKPTSKRIVVSKLEKETTLENIIKEAKTVNNPAAKAIAEVVSTINLEHVTPVYHRPCLSRFYKLEDPKTRASTTDNVIKHIIDYMQENKENNVTKI